MVDCLFPLKVNRDNGINPGEAQDRILPLDFLRAMPVAKSGDQRIDRYSGAINSEFQKRFGHADRAARGPNCAVWTMPNTMPGFCIEALRSVATFKVIFVRNRLSRRSL